MEMRPFQESDFETYRSWFADPDLNRELGPLDNEWLEYVLDESPLKEICFFDNGELVAVIGTETPKPGKSTWYITAIAVNPSRKRSGVGKRVVDLLIENHMALDDPPQAWIAWVDLSNSAARSFFTELGWIESVESDKDDMFKFTLKVK